MKVLFVKDAPGGKSASWRKGQIEDVSNGYAQNFLIPKGLARIATPQIIVQMQKESGEADAKRQKDLEKLNHLKTDLEKREFSLKIKVGDKGQVFGGVHEKDIAKAVGEKMGIAVEKSQVELKGIIKEMGEHTVKLKLAPGIIADLKIKIDPQMHG